MTERSHSLSTEEEQELVRSNKKVKDLHNEAPVDTIRLPGSTSFASKFSFWDKLVGDIPEAYPQAFAYLDHMDADSESDEETEELCDGMAEICLSKETKRRIRAPWAKALIVKVFGKTMGFNFLHAKLMGLWKPAGRVDKVDLGRDFFFMRFSLIEDLELVLKKGPWFISEHFLSIRRWEANFKLSEAQVSSVAVWVRFHELPIEYYDMEVLRQLGRALGTVLRVDTHTATEAWGRYARVCVQVDVSKPLVTSVRIGQRNQPVAYEGVSKLCFSCGQLGHQNETCLYSIKPPSSPLKDSHVMSNAEITGQTTANPEARTENQTED
ncbi:uncharacterized protein LOC126708343 [Quercus robur]|uniref:uncharacterized protein LOC126708343 n=1 Tax=Quercus robur TaxID=38942 RepID=UPI0021627912|nr:uncharacterized protein LOC126708343 [Quercus robur]